jgi:hypothetical protein
MPADTAWAASIGLVASTALKEPAGTAGQQSHKRKQSDDREVAALLTGVAA